MFLAETEPELNDDKLQS